MGKLHLLHELRNLRRDPRAVTAVEFALIGTLVLSLFISFLLMSVYQFWQMALDDAVRSAARQIEVGKVTTGTEFVTAVCAEFGVVAPCSTSNLHYNVISAATFGAMTPATVSVTTGALSTSSFPSSFTAPGTGGLPVLVQVVYTPVVRPPMVPNVLLTGNATPSLISAIALMVY
jgi:Flp pilus assembly protein TadG